MFHRLLRALCALCLLVFACAPLVVADDAVIPDPSAGPVSEELDGTEKKAETETEALMETETAFEIPPGIEDSLKKDTPVGEAAKMTPDECVMFLKEVYEANSARTLWDRHEDLTAVFALYSDQTQKMEEYSLFYAENGLYYSDDWSPGLEELRLLIRGEDDCVEDYTRSMRFVCFLNASGNAYRVPQADPVILGEETIEATLLSVYRTENSVFVITQLTEPSILRLDLEEPEEGGFYSCACLLDPATLEAQTVRISLHNPSDAGQGVTNVREIRYSYDQGMTPFVQTGLTGLMQHMDPEDFWDAGDLRTVTLTRDPGTQEEQVFSLTALKGDPVSITLPPGYEIWRDESLTTPWMDDGDYVSDLSLWAAVSHTAAPAAEGPSP